MKTYRVQAKVEMSIEIEVEAESGDIAKKLASEWSYSADDDWITVQGYFDYTQPGPAPYIVLDKPRELWFALIDGNCPEVESVEELNEEEVEEVAEGLTIPTENGDHHSESM